MLITIKILTWLASPLGIFVTSWLLALVLMLTARLQRPRQRSKWAQILVLLASLQLFALSLPAVSDALLGSLEAKAREATSQEAIAQRILQDKQYAAIVVLGGAVAPPHPPLRPHPDLNDAADRLWHAARLYKRGLSARIIVSGGKRPGMESRSELVSEAQLMRQFLMDMGVPAAAIITEENARTTRENAENSKKILAKILSADAKGKTPEARIALVTSAFHTPRATQAFKKAGFMADAFPSDFRVAPHTEPLYARLLPNAEALVLSSLAIKEYLALATGY